MPPSQALAFTGPGFVASVPLADPPEMELHRGMRIPVVDPQPGHGVHFTQPKFLGEFSGQGLSNRLAGLHLAAGELPASRNVGRSGTTRDEVEAVALDGCRDNDRHGTSMEMPAARQAISAATPASACTRM